MAAPVQRDEYQNPPLDDDDEDMIDPDDADLNDFDDPLQPSSSRTPLTGHIGGAAAPAAAAGGGAGGAAAMLSARIGGEDRAAAVAPGSGGTTTIDESVWATLRRDLLAVWHKLREVLWPRYLLGGTMFDSAAGLRGVCANLRGAGLGGGRDELAGLAGRVLDPEALLAAPAAGAASGRSNAMTPGLRDWDLWGPLIFCLLLSMLLSFHHDYKQRDEVFSGVFAMVWIGEAVVTLQIKLLGGNISFAQSVCIIGYTLFPLVIAALLSALGVPKIPRIPIYLVLVGWSLAAGISILGGSGVVKNRVGLAIYPLFVFYLGLGCLCYIS